MKNEIRKQILEARKALSPEEVIAKSTKIFYRLQHFPLYQNARHVLAYIDFRNEVKTDLIIKDLLSSGKNVIIPVSIPETKEMMISQVLDPEKELAKGAYGILEPKKEFIRKVNPDDLDLILVPGVAFDVRGYRIGYGGGYYDRFFGQQIKKIPSVALAYDFQIIEAVPRDFFDHPVDYIITETRTIACNS